MVLMVRELISKAGLGCYESIVHHVFSEVEKCGFKIAFREDCFESKIDWQNRLLRLSVKDGKQRKLEVLWDLLHEYGHLLDGEPSSDELQTYRRELNAWDRAKKIVQNNPVLFEQIESFEKKKRECLGTYPK